MDAFGKRVRAAAVAGWWTVIIGMIWMTAGWFWMRWVLQAKPEWVLTVWGNIITWEDAQDFSVWFFSIFKLILFVMILLTIWLTIWARKLKKVD
jgi:hypothetical protein